MNYYTVKKVINIFESESGEKCDDEMIRMIIDEVNLYPDSSPEEIVYNFYDGIDRLTD